MKPAIHPNYHPVVFQDASTGKAFLTRSTVTSSRTIDWKTDQGVRQYPLVVVDVTSDSHPFWTGTHRVLDSAGQVEKFRRRYG
ncbi:MAG: type B 50S ribosomal protein L31 [Mycobacterium sp.]